MSDPEASMERSGASSSGREHRLRFRTARDLFDEFPAVRQDMKAAPTDQDCIGFLNGLASSATPEEAITFTAYLLPPREAVWWAHQCLSYVPEALSETDRQMLAFAEAWVREPEEDPRNTALEAANDAETETPGVWVAFAAGWSGGSMGPRDVSAVPPPPFLTPRAVNAAVLGLLARIDNEHRDEMLRGFVQMAIKLTEA
jgi:hypothetical protein